MAILFAVQQLAPRESHKVIIGPYVMPEFCAPPTIRTFVASNPLNVAPGQRSSGPSPHRHSRHHPCGPGFSAKRLVGTAVRHHVDIWTRPSNALLIVCTTDDARWGKLRRCRAIVTGSRTTRLSFLARFRKRQWVDRYRSDAARRQRFLSIAGERAGVAGQIILRESIERAKKKTADLYRASRGHKIGGDGAGGVKPTPCDNDG